VDGTVPNRSIRETNGSVMERAAAKDGHR